jgi:hypothetical protein
MPSFNPLTGSTVLTKSQQHFSELAGNRTTVAKAAAASLHDDHGKLPEGVYARTGTATKVLYGMANFVTLGIVGQIGALCSRSACMGSQKPSIAKELGQIHLASTQDSGSFINTATKAWTHVVGFIPGHILGVGFALDHKMATGMATNKAKLKLQPGDGEFNFNRLKDVGVGKLGDLKNMAQPMWKKIGNELDQIAANVGDNGEDTAGPQLRAAMLTGSDELKGAFAQHLKSEKNDGDDAKYCAWSHGIMEKMKDPKFEMSAFEAAVARTQFVDNSNQVNIRGTLRNAAKSAFDAVLDPAYVDEVKTAAKNLKAAEVKMKISQKQGPKSPEHKANVAQYWVAFRTHENLRKASPKLTAEQTRSLAPSLGNIHENISRMFALDSMKRFVNRVADNNAVLSGLSPQAIENGRNRLDRKLDEVIDRYVDAGIFPRSEAATQRPQIAQSLWGNPTPAQLSDPGFLRNATSKADELMATSLQPVAVEEEAPAGPVLDGTLQDIPFAAPALTALGDLLNDGLQTKMASKDNWHTTHAENAGIEGSFERDFGRSKIVVNGQQLSGSELIDVDSIDQERNAKANCVQVGIPADDLAMISTFLHQGIGGDIQRLTQNDMFAGPDEQIAPTPLMFAHPETKENLLPGDGPVVTLDKNNDGTYSFSFSQKMPMDSVSQFGADGMKAVQTDPAQSRHNIEVTGVFDPKNSQAPVTVTGAAMSYSGVPL